MDKFPEAAEKYSKAIEADPEEAALYSNRAACYASMEMWAEVSDAISVLQRIRLYP